MAAERLASLEGGNSLDLQKAAELLNGNVVKQSVENMPNKFWTFITVSELQFAIIWRALNVCSHITSATVHYPAMSKTVNIFFFFFLISSACCTCS